MQLLQKCILIESENASKKDISYAISIVNQVYNEWRKTKRRINAVDIISTSVNKIAKITPEILDRLTPAARHKIAIIIMRCLDNPTWKPLGNKEKIYKKIYPLLKRLQNEVPNTGTGGNLKDIIMTRFSASLSYQMNEGKIFVAYEKKIPESYIRYLFGNNKPKRTYRMQGLSLPEDFETLINTLKINIEKAMKK